MCTFSKIITDFYKEQKWQLLLYAYFYSETIVYFLSLFNKFGAKVSYRLDCRSVPRTEAVWLQFPMHFEEWVHMLWILQKKSQLKCYVRIMLANCWSPVLAYGKHLYIEMAKYLHVYLRAGLHTVRTVMMIIVRFRIYAAKDSEIFRRAVSDDIWRTFTAIPAPFLNFRVCSIF